MDSTGLAGVLEAIGEGAVVFHGFTDFARDYDLVVALGDGDRGPPRFRQYRFNCCVAAEVRSSLSPEARRASSTSGVIDGEAEPTDHVWGMRGQNVSSATLVSGSSRARQLADVVGIDFHEVRIAAAIHTLTLVFSDVEVTVLRAGHTPVRLGGAPSGGVS